MRAFVAALALLPALALTVAGTSHQAHACGGCFVQQSESTQVTGHRMVLSVSMQQTTLYDQITYAGDPEDFAWVLPIRGQVDVGLSSDALFETLEALTRVEVYSPQISCPPPQSCTPNFGSTSAGTGGGSGGGDPVQVIAQEVVGPYETVQLKSEDPAALNAWLDQHGYNVPDDVEPIINAYVAEGFDFLALRLVPGQGIAAMRPVRVTSPGAGPALPLRMVAAGTGAVTPISLWIIGEGRYEPQNFPSFRINGAQLVWNWDTQSSNYSALRSQGFAATNGAGWLIDAGEFLDPYAFENLFDLAQYDAENSGYADPDGTNALANAHEDIDTLLAGINPSSAMISHLSAELARSALANDLALQASLDQGYVQRTFWVENTVGTEPECPVQPPIDCGDNPAFPGAGGASSSGAGASSSEDGSDGCSAASSRTTAGWGVPVVIAGLVLRLARRRKRAP